MIRRFLLVLVIASASTFGPMGWLPGARAQSAAVSTLMTEAVAARDQLPSAMGSLWRFEGPSKQEGGGKGFQSGRINDLAIQPSNPLIMYATGATGGVWKTTDGGTTWASRSNGLLDSRGAVRPWPIQSATAVAVDPVRQNRVFVGTGDKNVEHVEPFSAGIMRSLDGGLTWQQFGAADMCDFVVTRIVVDPDDPRVVMAATGRGSRRPGGHVFRSTDGGENWDPVTDLPDANWDDLRMSGGKVYWAAATRRHDLDPPDAGGSAGLLYRSPDRGASWTPVTLTTATFDLGAGLPEVVLIGTRGSAVFVVVYVNSQARVFVTSDTTEPPTWAEMTPAIAPQASSYPWARSGFCATATQLYVGGTSLFRGGFVDGVGLVFTAIPGPVHEDVQCVVPDPLEPDAVFLCTDGGVYHHSLRSNATKSLSATLGVTQAYRMELHERHGGLIAIGSQDLGNSVSFANGSSAAALLQPPTWAVVQTGDGRSGVFRQDGTQRVYLANTDGRVRKFDGATGVNLQCTDAPNSQGPLLFNDETLFYADTEFSQLSSPETAPTCGQTTIADWEPSFLFRPAGPLPAPIQALAMCPSNRDVMYAGSGRGELFFSENEGRRWTEITGLPVGVPIWAISPSPTNCRDVIVALGYDQVPIRAGIDTIHTGNRLLRNPNVVAGSWIGLHGVAPELPRAPLFAIARLSSAPDLQWFVAGDVGVFRTDDAGEHWRNATAPLGLPNTLVRDLRLSGDENTLYAATFGRGVWSMDVNPPARAFGIRGVVTQASRPLRNVTVSASGPGRIKQWLKNTIVNPPPIGFRPTTAPIHVTTTAGISSATASLFVRSSPGSSPMLVAPSGMTVPMTELSIGGGLLELRLPTSSASRLVGLNTAGDWKFSFNRIVTIESGFVDLQFNGSIATTTAPDGEYSLAYLSQGSHVVTASLPGLTFSRTLTLASNQTDVNFAASPVGVASLTPQGAKVQVHEPLNYRIAYTITDGRSWREISSVQLIIRKADAGATSGVDRDGEHHEHESDGRHDDDSRDERDGREERSEPPLWISFDPVSGTLKLVDQDEDRRHGHRRWRGDRVNTATATARLVRFARSVPDASSVTFEIEVTFKRRADEHVYTVELFATDEAGNSQGPYAVGRVQVGEITVPLVPPVIPEDGEL